MMTEVGSASIDEKEAERLREYLLKGGFLWADDFWGSYAWDWWVSQFSKVLPPAEYPIIDLPSNHPLFSSQFVIKKVPQIASINFWARAAGVARRSAMKTAPKLMRARFSTSTATSWC